MTIDEGIKGTTSTIWKAVMLVIVVQSQSKLYYDGRLVLVSWCQATIWDLRPIFSLFPYYFCRQLQVCWRGAPSLTRGQVCSFQFLLSIASAVFAWVWVPRYSWAYSIVSVFEAPRTWRAKFLDLFPPGTGHWVCLINLYNITLYIYSFLATIHTLGLF
jgi:hypothetical protein